MIPFTSHESIQPHVSADWNTLRFYPRSGWARFLTRAPLVAWRLGLGPISGKLFLVLTTTGRKSGIPRHAMVEYYSLDGIKYAACAFGAEAQYYKNIQADPRVTIQTADGTESARASRVTDDDELVAVYELFKRRDPFMLNWYLNSLGIKPDAEDVVANKERVYFLRFEPSAEVGPGGLDVDLAWLWPLALLGLLAWRWLRSFGR
jgi:deazaflavin-dependent oxidoreductase (nitroreductase family)